MLRPRMRSVNFMGTRDWSDGASTAWWSAGLQPLVSCSACSTPFWIEDLEPLGELPYQPRPIGRVERVLARWRGDPTGRLQAEEKWLQVPEGWKSAERGRRVELDDLAVTLAQADGLDRDKLLWLRRRIWWSMNDRFRDLGDSAVLDAPAEQELDERANMQALLELLDAGEMDAGDMVEKGELLRQLGCFDDAVAVLKAVPANGYDEVRAVRIEALARAGDRVVRELLRQ